MKYGLSLEQGKKKVDEIISSRGRPEDTRVAQLEEEVRKLGRQIELKRTGASSTAGRGSAGVLCSTCTRPTHSRGIGLWAHWTLQGLHSMQREASCGQDED